MTLPPLERASFPEDSGFTVARLPGGQRTRAHDRTLAVIHNPTGRTLLVVTWCAPSKTHGLGVGSDPYQTMRLIETREAHRVFRIHSIGTRLGVYVSLCCRWDSEGIWYSPHPPIYSTPPDSILNRWDTDLLAPCGFERLVTFICTALEAVQSPIDRLRQDLENIQVSSVHHDCTDQVLGARGVDAVNHSSCISLRHCKVRVCKSPLLAKLIIGDLACQPTRPAN